MIKQIVNRISPLDGLRVVAITMVMLFHFYFLHDTDKYEYNYNLRAVFRFGYLGVELFFIISGFVISMSLTKCNSFKEFIVKRFIRLFPTMLICALFTFLVFNLFDNEMLFSDSHNLSNLLISITFINPELINTLLGTELTYIDGSYWSLWVEITFYIIVGLLYFGSPNNIIRNFSIVIVVSQLFWYTIVVNSFGLSVLRNIELNHMYSIFRFFHMSLWFFLGMLLFELYKNNKNYLYLFLFVVIYILQIFLILKKGTLIFGVFSLSFFLLLIYQPKIISFMGKKNISAIGIASYSIYLIHQNIGILLINKLSPYFGRFNFILPIIIILSLYVFGLLSYRYLEKPLGLLLKRYSFKFINIR